MAFSCCSDTRKSGNSVELKQGKNRLLIEVCDHNIIKIRYKPNSETSLVTPSMNDAEWKLPLNAKIDIHSNPITVETYAMRTEIDKIDWKIRIYDKNKKILLEENDIIDGKIAFTHNPENNLYGLNGYNRNDTAGLRLTRNDGGEIGAKPQGGCGAPFVWTTDGWGIIVDTDGGNILNIDGKLSLENCSRKDIECYIIIGKPKEIIAGAGKIAGLPPMFPKWNCGFGQLEWGIDEEEFMDHIENYRRRNFPLDWFMIDFDWMAWGEDNYGEFRWGTKFPGAHTGVLQTWADSVGVKMTAITKPRIVAKKADGSFTEQGEYAENHCFWFSGEDWFTDYASKMPSKDLNFALADCRAWWWSHLKEGGFDKGMKGFLNDECDDSNQGGMYSLGNYSNLFMQQAIYEGQRGVSDLRVWSVNRTAYLGSQRYAYGLWSGDNIPSFTDLRSQLTKMLAANNVLVPTWGFCVTAFGTSPAITEEFYIRSMQLGLFAPLFFLHGMYNVNKQPWLYGSVVEKISKEAVDLRYRLIPYIYSYEWQKHKNMLGISRALLVEFPSDKETADIDDTFMFGDYLLASPILASGVSHKKIYLPEGEWIDYFTGKRFEGRQYIDYKIDNKSFRDIPLFIRNGAIIPSQDVMNHIGEKNVEQIYIDIFPSSKTTHFQLYDDDGLTYSYEDKNYFLQDITVKDDSAVSLSFSSPEGVFKPTFKRYILRIHGIRATSVDMGGKICSSDKWTNGRDVYGDVTIIVCPVMYDATNIIISR
jgi:alpha-glucosidase